MRRPATGVSGAGRIDGGVALLDVGDFALGIDHECCAVGDPGVLDQHSIRGGHFPFREIAQERNGEIVLLRELPLRRNIVGADAEYLGPGPFKFSDTSLVSLKFLGSTTGERRREECQHDGALALEVGELDAPALSGRQIEIRRLVSYL